MSFAREYEIACQDTVTQAQAFAEIDKHDLGVDDPHALFLSECGDFPEYPGQLVLDWLNY